jgi:MFS family permease
MTDQALATFPPRAASRFFYGWVIVLVASAAMVGTLPGRTQGLGLITEPLLADLRIDHVTWAEVNLWATLVGACGAVGIGQLVDRAGSRTVLTGLAIALGAVVVMMSRASSLMAMAVLVTLTRALGQSALSVVSLAMIAPWFVKRIDAAMAAYSLVLSVGFMIAFPVVGSLVQERGWRTAWLFVGVALIGALAPLAWLAVRRRPSDVGLEPDGPSQAAGTAAASADAGPDVTWSQALSSPAFWVFSIGTALYGLVASGIGLFNESILAQRGFGPSIYYQTLVVTALTALVGNFAGGALASRIKLTRLMGVALLVLATGLTVLPFVSSGAQVMAWAALMGLGGGLVMVVFFSAWPRVFGRVHLGRIQGTAQAMTVVASAIGPLLLARWVQWTGSYGGMFTLLGFVVTAVAMLAFFVPLPATADVTTS